jgi:hypothetical protein
VVVEAVVVGVVEVALVVVVVVVVVEVVVGVVEVVVGVVAVTGLSVPSATALLKASTVSAPKRPFAVTPRSVWSFSTAACVFAP